MIEYGSAMVAPERPPWLWVSLELRARTRTQHSALVRYFGRDRGRSPRSSPDSLAALLRGSQTRPVQSAPGPGAATVHAREWLRRLVADARANDRRTGCDRRAIDGHSRYLTRPARTPRHYRAE
jgi:hypothetical protein